VRATPLLTAGALVALAGLVLLVVETSRTLGGTTLGGAGPVLLWVGVGLVALGGLALLLAVVSDSRQPADG
jgi:hypothetical protein